MAACRVLVTGASGFVGQYVVRDLAASGYDVIAASRNATSPVPGITHRQLGDIADTEGLDSVMRGVECVVHLAARAHKMRDISPDPLADFLRVNVEGTRRLAVAAARSGARRFVFLSTVKTLGEITSDRSYQESDSANPVDPYGFSKMKAEQALAETAAEEGLEFVILRAPLVYGPHVRANVLALFRAADSGLPLPFGGIRKNRRSLIYIGNLSSAIRRAMEHPAAAGQTYLVRDGEDISTAQLVASVRRALGRPRRLVPVPAWLLHAGLAGLGKRAAAHRLLNSLQVDDSAIRRELDWNPPFSTSQGLAATAAWYRRTRRPHNAVSN